VKTQQQQSGNLNCSAVAFGLSGKYQLAEGLPGDPLAGDFWKIQLQSPNAIVDLGVLGEQTNQADGLADDPMPDVVMIIHRRPGKKSFLVNQIGG
jgi:hypothetical protein